MSGSIKSSLTRRILNACGASGGRNHRRRLSKLALVESLEVRQLLAAVSSMKVEARVAPPPRTANAPSGGSNVAAALTQPVVPLNQTFLLNSRPGATKTIFLDFDGHTTTGTSWNFYTNGAPIVSPAFDLDGNAASFSNTELLSIQEIWVRVSEDFAPFDVNVTTQDPGVANLTRSGVGDTRWGIRCVTGGSSSDWYTGGAAGVAMLDSFGSATDVPCFNFPTDQFGVLLDIADTASHEVGHTLGLGHDGGPGAAAYYGGHGFGNTAWAPIMGAGFGIPVSQWSIGEYPGANNKEDDLAIITRTANGFGFRADDYGNSRFEASQLSGKKVGSVRSVSVSGVIERRTDQDWFSFTTTGGNVTLNFGNAAAGANLDIAATLYDASGSVLLTSNPAFDLFAGFTANLPPGTYYLSIDGVGAGTLATGYSDYGSLGKFTITGTIADTSPSSLGSSSIEGRVGTDANFNGLLDPAEGISGVMVFIDVDGNGVFNASIDKSARTSSNGTFKFTGLFGGFYNLYQVVPTGWQEIASTGANVFVNANQTKSGVEFRNVRPPVLSSIGGSVAYKTGAAPVLLAPTGKLTDADTIKFTGGTLTVGIAANAQATDVVSIRNQGNGAGQVGYFGGFVRFGGVTVGTVSGGIAGSNLVITFNVNATLAVVNAVLKNITFSTTTAGLPRTLTFSMTDGKGGISTTLNKSVSVS